jgi:hypothetical protein
MIIAPSDGAQHFGKLRATTNYCVRAADERTGSGVVEMALCREYMYERTAMFEMNEDGAIFRGDLCLEPDRAGRLILRTCDESANQRWELKDSHLTVVTSPRQCLTQISDRDPNTMDLFHYARLQECSKLEDDHRKQTWKFINY